MQKKSFKIFSTLLFLFAIPVKASAFSLGIGESIVRNLLWTFLWLVSKLLWIAQSIFTYSLTISTSFSDKLTVIEVGWKVARDATNIFFIIILLIMSIGTILRLQNYNAKRLLVNLVLMAILINFSLAIGSVVIDFSNVLGLQFLTAIHPEFKVSDVIMENLQVTDMFKSDIGSTARTDLGDLSTYATIVMGNAILMVVLVFVFFVSGIVMFIRLAILMLLLVVAPIAFVLYILPDTKSQFDKWWKTLIDYSFFFPAYAFLLYVSVKMIIELNKIVAETTTTLNLKSGGFGSVPQNLNFISNVNLLVGYFIACVFLITSLVMGKSMSLYGANAVVGWAKTGRKYVTGALGSGALYPVRGITRRIAETEGVQRLKDRLQESRYIPKGIGAAASRGIDAMLQRGAVIGQMRPKSAEQTADFLARQSEDNIVKAWGGLSYMQKLALLRKLSEERRKKLMELLPDENQKQLALRMSRGFEGEGRAGELEAAEWQRIKASSDPNAHENSMKHFANMSRAGKERALRTMDQKEQADYITKLRAAKLTDAADQSEDIIRTEFTQQQRAAYDVAGFQRLSTDEQLDQIGRLSNEAASAFLHAKSPEERKAFIDALRLRDSAKAVLMDKVMADYFAPEDLRKHRVAIFNTKKDPADIAAGWTELTVQEQEDVMRARDARQRTSLLGRLQTHGGTLVVANAMQVMQDALTRAELAKTNAILNIKQTGSDRQAVFDVLEDMDISEVFNELKTPEEQWDYINSLDETKKDALGRGQQTRALDMLKQTLPPDAFDDFRAYEVVNRTPVGQRGQEFVNLTEKQRIKALRGIRGKPRADLIAEINQFNIGTTRDGWNAVVDAGRRMTERERDQINREICGQLQDTY